LNARARGKVVVVGSVSVDVTAFGRRTPAPGETVLGESFTLVMGGKGANQALAAARAGAATSMIGCVGDDLFRSLVLTGLSDGGVDTSAIATVPGPTGVAHIRVNAGTGQNDIVMIPLANSSLTPGFAEKKLKEVASAGDVLLLQLEIPRETAVHAAVVARQLGMTVILDPAPASALPDELWPTLDIVTPNESEASRLVGFEVNDSESAARAGGLLMDRGVETVLITLAERGVVEVTTSGVRRMAAPEVEVLDSTAAGDAFVGTLGASMVQGLSWDESVNRAIHAGALAVTIAGASTSLPTAQAVSEFISSRMHA
jgi:ribokinase